LLVRELGCNLVDTVSPTRRRRARAKKDKKTTQKRPAREPNELELLVARGVARVADFADATLQVVERDPERAVNAVVSAIEGVGKIGEFIRTNPDEARRVVRGLASEGVNRLSVAVISAGARQLRKDLNGKRERK
jgi:transcription antitermination factor NusA-like protein